MNNSVQQIDGVTKPVIEITTKERLQKYKKLIRLYVIPLFALGIFLGVLVFVVVPKIGSIMDRLGELSDTRDKLSESNTKIQNINSLVTNINEVLSYLQQINNIAPTGDIELVRFRSRVFEIAESSGLVVDTQGFRESDIVQDPNLPSSSTLLIKEVPVEIEVIGTLDNIYTFLDEITKLEDFVIIKDFELARNADNVEWVFTLRFIKYQFAQDTEGQFDQLYLNVPVSSKIDQEVKNYLDKRNPNQAQSEDTGDRFDLR